MLHRGCVAAFGAALLMVGGAPSALAEESAPSLPITPGKWQFELSTMLAMATEPQLNSRSQCITTDRLDPASFLSGTQGSSCTVSDLKVEGKTMRWTQLCTQQRGSSKAKAEATVNGDSATGKMEMHIMIGSHPVPIVTTWKAKRVGQCEAVAE